MTSSDAFKIGDWTVYPNLGRICRGSEEHSLRPQVTALLVCLASRNGDVALTADLHNELWPDRIVSDATLYNCVAELRKVLDRHSEGSASILTIPKKGYQLQLPVSGFPDHSNSSREIETAGSERQSSLEIRRRRLIYGAGILLIGALALLGVDYLDPFSDENALDSGLPERATSIAVLAFANLSEDAGNGYLADGISEEISNLLAKVPAINVISSSSAFSLKGRNLDIPTIAAQLKVDFILEGSVRRHADQLRITTHLIRTADDSKIWSETYEKEFEDVFAIQDEISSKVVNSLQVELLGDMPQLARTHAEAYALYLKAHHLARLPEQHELAEAESILRQVLNMEPAFSPAWAELAAVLVNQGILGFRPVDEAIELGRQAAEQSLSRDPDNGRAWAILGRLLLYYELDFQAANKAIGKALASSPGDAEILRARAALAMAYGDLETAVTLLRQSATLNPLSLNALRMLGNALNKAGRSEEAEDVLRTTLSLYPDGRNLHVILAMAMLGQGEFESAIEEIKKEPADVWRFYGTAIIEYARGNVVESDSALMQFIEGWSDTGQFQIAELYAHRGDVDLAFEWLDRAREARDGGIVYIKISPFLASLHGDPRWGKMLYRLGLPH